METTMGERSPWVPFFAWRPVWTRFHGWTWLRRIWRRRDFAPAGAEPQMIVAWPMWEYCRGGPFDDLPQSTREHLRSKPGAEAMAQEFFRDAASGRCGEHGEKLREGKCWMCEWRLSALLPKED
jgi:hypothetical protein